MLYINDLEQCYYRLDIFQWMCFYKVLFFLIYIYIFIILVLSFFLFVVDFIFYVSLCFVFIIRQIDVFLWKGRLLFDVYCVIIEFVFYRDLNIFVYNFYLFVSGVVQILVEFYLFQFFFC